MSQSPESAEEVQKTANASAEKAKVSELIENDDATVDPEGATIDAEKATAVAEEATVDAEESTADAEEEKPKSRKSVITVPSSPSRVTNNAADKVSCSAKDATDKTAKEDSVNSKDAENAAIVVEDKEVKNFTLSCEICDYVCNKEANLNAHMSRKHPTIEQLDGNISSISQDISKSMDTDKELEDRRSEIRSECDLSLYSISYLFEAADPRVSEEDKQLAARASRKRELTEKLAENQKKIEAVIRAIREQDAILEANYGHSKF